MDVAPDRTGRLLDRLGAAVNLRAGEAPLVAWMMLHSLLNGVPKTLTNSAASAIFLEQHGAKYLPYAYMASAVIVTLIGWGFLKLGKLVSFASRLQLVLVILFAGDLLLRVGIAVLGVERASVVFPVWTEIEWSVFPLAYWGLAGQLFNVQQGKRIFTLLGLGELVSSTLLGFLLPQIVSWIGATNVLLVSAAGTFGSLLAMRKVLSLAGARLSAVSEEHGEEEHGEEPASDRYRGYTWLLFALVGFSFLSAYFLDNVFSSRAEARYPNADELAGFLGVFWGSCNLLALVFKAGLAGRLLSRYGLSLGILALPLVLLFGQGSAAVSGLFSTATAVMFWIVVVTRALDYVTRDGLDGPSGLILFQPLPPAVRAAAQAKAEGIIGPIAGGVSGLVLAFVTHVLHFTSAEIAGMAATAAAGWLFVAWKLRHDYQFRLEEALAGRRLRGLTISVDDPATRAVLERGIESPRPGEALYALQVIEELDSRALEPTLVRLLGHPDPAVRVSALLRVEKRGFESVLPAVEELLAREQTAEVRGAAVRVLAALGHEGRTPEEIDAQEDRIAQWLEHGEREVRDGAVVGLLRSGGVGGIVAGGQRLIELVRSPDPADRLEAAGLLNALEMESFHRPLGALLRDPDLRVRRKALAAAETHGSPRLWPLLCENLTLQAVRQPAARALVAAGEPVLPLLEQLLLAPRAGSELRVRIASICGRVGGTRASQLLLKMMQTAGRAERTAVLAGLAACGWQAQTEPETLAVKSWLEEELVSVRALAAARLELAAEPKSLLGRALNAEVEAARDRVLLVLALLYDSRSVLRARAAFARPSADERALAGELVQSLLPLEARTTVGPLLEELSHEELHEKLSGGALQLPNGPQPVARLLALLDPRDRVRSEWLAVCALHELGLRGASEAWDRATEFSSSDEPLLRETAARVKLLLETPGAERTTQGTAQNLSEEGPMLLTIEKVMILRSVQIFAETPDSVLAEIAAILKQVEVAAGVTIFNKGDTGDCLYVIGSGKVRIHDGDLTLTTLGERDIFGELALLDAEPRSATATAETPTRLFRVDQEAFYDLMADRIEVVRGILRVLCRRVRAKNLERVQASGPGSPPMAPARPAPTATGAA
jgi:HEAT repeat protein